MIKLGETTFEVPAPGGLRSFALQQRILPVAGRVAGVFLQLLDGGQIGDLLKPDTDVTKVLPLALPAIGEIFAAMPQGELETITRELLRDAKGNGLALFIAGPGGGAFDALMAGRTMDTWKLLWHALQVWYPDFFSLAVGFKGQVATRAKGSEGSTASTG